MNLPTGYQFVGSVMVYGELLWKMVASTSIKKDADVAAPPFS